jgi:hypothetical protein
MGTPYEALQPKLPPVTAGAEKGLLRRGLVKLTM